MSKTTSKTVTVGEWQAALAQMNRTSVDVVPEGWKTGRQIAEEMGRSVNTIVTRVISPLMRAGKAETKRFRIQQPMGGVRLVPHYRLK